jgi:hypothetical protein
MKNLTFRQIIILHAALSYVLPNVDDLNEAFLADEEDGKIGVHFHPAEVPIDTIVTDPVTEEEIEELILIIR